MKLSKLFYSMEDSTNTNYYLMSIMYEECRYTIEYWISINDHISIFDNIKSIIPRNKLIDNGLFFAEMLQCENSEELKREVNWFFNACLQGQYEGMCTNPMYDPD